MTTPISISIHEVFIKDATFSMPLFQRLYCWKANKQIEQYCEDIERAMAQDDQIFLGAVVYQVSADVGKGVTNIVVIDGQQRLTTLFITLIALAKFAYENNWVEDAETIILQYLLHRLPKIKNMPKLFPTNLDFCQMNTILKSITPSSPKLHKNLGKSEGDLIRAWKKLDNWIDGHLNNKDVTDKKGQWESIYDAIIKKMELVEIVVGDNHDANEVFDRLNDRGQKLQVVDLVRNEVFKRVSNIPSEAQDLFEHHWKPFEESFSDDELDGYFWPFALIQKPQAPKSRMFKTLTTHWNSTVAKKGKEAGELIIADLDSLKEPYFAILGNKVKSGENYTKIWGGIRIAS